MSCLMALWDAGTLMQPLQTQELVNFMSFFGIALTVHCITSSVETPGREEARLPHQHHRIADPHFPRNADGSKDADVILMVICGSTENPQIAPEIGLPVGRHDAA